MTEKHWYDRWWERKTYTDAERIDGPVNAHDKQLIEDCDRNLCCGCMNPDWAQTTEGYDRLENLMRWKYYREAARAGML